MELIRYTNSFVHVAVLLLLASTTVLFQAGCRSGLPSSQTRIYAGRVAGTDALIAIVADEDRDVMVYVCDGVAYANWFKASYDDELDLVSNGARLQVRLRGASAEGTFISAQGTGHTFVAEKADGEAWLYRAVTSIDGLKYVGGWIVLQSGEQRGAVMRDGVIVASPHLDTSNPSSVEVAGAGRLAPALVGEDVDA